MPFLTDDILTRSFGDDRWELTRALIYQGQRDTFVIPAGYVTDYATVPRVVSWLIPRYGRYTRAAILHDYLITDRLGTSDVDRLAPWPVITPTDVDGLFRRVLRELGVSAPRRWLMWAGVRYGALFGGRRTGWLRTAPAVLGISVLALPVVAPGVVVVAVCLALFGLIEWVAG
jgi:hypothetical protein